MATPTTASIFPLIRLVSSPLSRWLVRTPLSANAITTGTLAAGLAACYLTVSGAYDSTLAGAILLLVCYVLDNCDGYVARAKDQCTPFGDKYDTFVDWLIHTLYFIALGWGAASAAGAQIWFWFGLSAALGGTVNYLIGLFESSEAGNGMADEVPPVPQGVAQWFAFVLRELFRADFCFIVLALALAGVVQYLLPLAALGAHAYWITRFVKGAREFHV